MIWTTRPRSKSGALAAIEAGSGPLVVLIHGVGLRAETWAPQIDALAQSCRVVAVDLPGHGESARLDQAKYLADYTDAISTVLNEPALVVGHSLGAMIALDLAISRPDLVCGVAALNAIYQRGTEAQNAVLTRANSLDGTTMADPTTTLQRWFGDTNSAARMACDDWLRGVDPAGYRDAYRVFASENGPSSVDLSALTCPALFVTGAAEPNSTPAMSQTMAAITPQGKAHIVEGAAHMMPMTHADRITQILDGFQTILSHSHRGT